jgi:signal transduction histidine kinase
MASLKELFLFRYNNNQVHIFNMKVLMSRQVHNISTDTFYLNLLKGIPEAIIVCDSKYKVIFVNDTFLKLYDSENDDISEKKLQSIISNTSKIPCHICQGNPTKYIPEENYSHQAIFTDSVGKELLIRISHSVLEADNTYYISTFSPMSDLICLDQAQIDFVSTVSHELRTPMTSIKGFADTLLAAGDQLDAEQRTRFISIIKSQADRLTRLVENLLTVSRLETKKHKSVYRAIKLVTFIEKIIFGLRNKHPHHKFRIETTENLPEVWADQDKLEQILTNLLDNAAKYSKEGTTVTVKTSLLPEDPDRIEIKVIDQGIGIDKKYLPNIFNKFSRIDNPLTRQVQGTGLGLYITKALTESMGGKISVESGPKGSTFTVVLNVATPERQAKQGFAEE